jgi:hypothetical protein
VQRRLRREPVLGLPDESRVKPKDEGGGDEHRAVVGRTLLVARRQSTPLLEPIDTALTCPGVCNKLPGANSVQSGVLQLVIPVTSGTCTRIPTWHSHARPFYLGHRAAGVDARAEIRDSCHTKSVSVVGVS